MKTKYLLAVVTLAVLPFIPVFAQAPGAPGISPATAEVVRLAGAGTSEDVVVAYIQNSQTPFNLSADHVLYLKDLGVPSSVVAAMLTHDSAMHAQASPPQVEAPPPAAAPVPMPGPGPGPEPGPPAGPPQAMAVSTPPADVAYFYNDLSPYGTWVDMPGAGWCWRPAVCATVGGWQPYMHGGHWMNTDAGWFWASDYSWGWAPFHYGRWQLHPTAGWVWFPGRVWGPSWVVWRSGGDHCGWAPLPPHADFVAGVGWSYNGVHVGATFDFGLSVGCFSFVSCAHFGDHNLYSYCVPHAQVTQIYHNTTIINNVTYVNNTYVNHGVNVNVFERASGHKFETVKVSESHTGVAGTGGAYRHPLPPPAPIHTLTATKMDVHGRVPTTLSANPKITGTPVTGSANKFGTSSTANTGAQKGTPALSNVKSTGATHNFSAESKPQTGTSVNPNKNGTAAGTGAASSGTISNPKAYNYQGNPPKSQTDLNAQNKQVHPGDVRGADALTTRENKFNTPSAQGTGQKSYSTGNTGNNSASGNANRYQSNPNLQHSGSTPTGGSKGSSGSGANKDPNNGGTSR